VKRLHASAGWAIVAIGVLHLLVTFVLYETPSLSALWFASSGLAVVLIGALHLLAATAARGIRVVHAVAAGASAAGVVLAATFSMLTDWSEPQGPVLLALFAFTGACAVLAALADKAHRARSCS
jgi:peptidoglycan/LPS O-acetylase OafA/YrhL